MSTHYSPGMGFIGGYLKSPFSGIVPWVLMSVVSGPGRFEEAASAALGLMLLTLWAGSRRGIRVHLLETFGAAFFGVLAILGLVAPHDVIEWLEVWAGELSSIALASFAIVTLLIRKPFTMAYARDTTPPEYWDTPQFKKINDAISAAWAFSFTVSAISGAISNTVMRDGDDFWTSWILPLAATFFAIQFTEFYPDHATAKFAREIGEPTGEPGSLFRLFDWVPPFVVATGIAGWVSDAVPAAVGIGLIVVGSVASWLLRKPDETKV
jgi:hypothetical protein